MLRPSQPPRRKIFTRTFAPACAASAARTMSGDGPKPTPTAARPKPFRKTRREASQAITSPHLHLGAGQHEAHNPRGDARGTAGSHARRGVEGFPGKVLGEEVVAQRGRGRPRIVGASPE